MRVWIAAVLAALALPRSGAAGTVFLLDGRGWGHGVGMSQWGAEGTRATGSSYRQILAHYYPHTHIGIAGAARRSRAPRGEAGLGARRLCGAVPRRRRARQEAAPAGPAVVVNRKFMLGNKHLRPPLRFDPGAQPLTLGGAAYRGDARRDGEARRADGVNLLPLDRYLRGVVPWEAPKGWHAQTYEAQAVAARSYTLATLHPNADFDLYPDQRSQMYGGIGRAHATNLAVGATAGRCSSGATASSPPTTSRRSGGRTSSVHDAWPRSHQVPYLVSVSDPTTTSRRTMSGRPSVACRGGRARLARARRDRLAGGRELVGPRAKPCACWPAASWKRFEGR